MLSFATTPPTGTTANPDANFSTNSRVDQRARPLSDKASAAAADAGWSIVPSPNVSGASYHLLNGVTCVSASDCWAVGYYAGASFQTLIEHWDGIAWAIVPSPNSSATQFNFLNSVGCVSASDCWAVGYYQSGLLSTETLIEHWDGFLWTIVPSPDATATRQNYLNSVTCLSASDCWAVGYYQTTDTIFQTLIEHWDGTSWTIISSPNTTPTQTHVLYGVTCVSASDCWAVGTYDVSDGTRTTTQALIAHWDGMSWSIVPSPNSNPAQNNYLRSVACLSGSDCWAVDHSFSSFAGQTLIEHWDGTSWAMVDSPNSSPMQDSFLFGGTCASAADCWAVGHYDLGSGVTETLTLRYTANVPTPTKVISRKTHGTAGELDINLPLAGVPGIESRSGGANNDHQMVLTFASPVTFESAAVTSGSGSVSSSSGSGTAAVTLNLTGVTNAQTITLTLVGVNDGTNTGDVAVRMRVLSGDSNADGIVSNTDVTMVKAQVSSPVTASNFRSDMNANGIVSNTDVSVTKAQVSTTLP